MYAGGAFKFVVGFPHDYPLGSSLPVLRFVGDVPFHPLVVDSTGEASTRYPLVNGIYDGLERHTALTVAGWAKRLLAMSEKELALASAPDFCLNEEAATMLAGGKVTHDYVKACQESAHLSNASLFVRKPPDDPSEAARMRDRALAQEEKAYARLLGKVEGTADVARSPVLSAARSDMSEGGETDGVLLRALAVVPSSHALATFKPHDGASDWAAFLERERNPGALERFLLGRGGRGAPSDAPAPAAGAGGVGTDGSGADGAGGKAVAAAASAGSGDVDGDGKVVDEGSSS